MVKARKRFGQHFLVEPGTLQRIHDELAIQPDQKVLEVGPGHGELTAGILQTTHQVRAVELDRDLAQKLRARYPQLEVVQADVLGVTPSLFRGHRVVGNLPYNISTPFLLRLTSDIECIDIHLMLQKEVVARLTAVPGTKAWGRLSIKIQQLFDVIPLFEVDAEAFEPAPQVQSAFIRLIYKNKPDKADNPVLFDEVLRQAFSQRRKTITNSLSSFQIDWGQLTIDPRLRADQLSVADYVQISNVSKLA